MRKAVCAFLFFCLATINIAFANSPTNTDWLYFVGLKNNEWKVFAKALEGEQPFQELTTQSEPREIYLQADQQRLYYLDASSQLRRFDYSDGQDNVILKAKGKHSYAQPFVDAKSNQIFLVYMPAGESSKADIVSWNGQQVSPVVKQLSSQFEPFVHNSKWLYFGHVHCSIDCGRIIQEIWRKNIISGESEQVTLQGHIARQPIVDAKGQWLYFSSNKAGRYHIWRQQLNVNGEISQPIAITQGSVSDSDPALDGEGSLYFIRRANAQASLMKLDATGELKVLTLPNGVKEIRNMRINH